MLVEIVKGMAFTLRAAFSRNITVQYPEEHRVISARHRGRHILHRYDNGLEKCIGCELCSGACPVGCIYVEPAENDPAHPVSPGERYALRYEINLVRCIYCGYCAEACPTEAITLGPRYDLADYRRERLVATKEDLLEAWSGPPEGSGDTGPGETRGAGSDQRTQPQKLPVGMARQKWEERFGITPSAGGNVPMAGQNGVPVDVPSVAPPVREKHEGTRP